MKASGHGPVREKSRVLAWQPFPGALIGVFAFLAAIAATSAFAADNAGSGGSEAIFIAELGLLLVVGRLMGEVGQRIGQPPVMGQLIGGLLLGPSVFGVIWPEAQHTLFPDSGARKSMV